MGARPWAERPPPNILPHAAARPAPPCVQSDRLETLVTSPARSSGAGADGFPTFGFGEVEERTHTETCVQEMGYRSL